MVLVADVAAAAGAVGGILGLEITASFHHMSEERGDGWADDGALEEARTIVLGEGDTVTSQTVRALEDIGGEIVHGVHFDASQEWPE